MRENLVKSEEFKDSPLGKIPKDWNYLTINDCLRAGLIVDVQDGNHGEAHPKTDDFVSEGIPFVMAKDLVNGQINLADCHKITWHQYQSLRVGFAHPGDVLLSHKGTIGLTAIVPDWLQHVMLTPQVTYYRLSEGNKLSGKFLFWFFQSPLFQQRLEVFSAQSTRSYIGITLQKTLSILVPPFDEQKRIAELLDTIDSTIAHTSSLIAKLKLMKAGLLHDLLTRGLDENGELRDAIGYPEQFKDSPLGRIPEEWESLILEEICSLVTNGYVGPTRDIYRQSGFPYLVSKNVKPNTLIKEAFAFVDEVFQRANKRSILHEGDVLTVQTGVNIGDTCVVPKEFEGANCHALIISRPIPDILHSQWLSNYLNSPIGRKTLDAIATGLAHPHLNSTLVRKLRIPVPSLQEQLLAVQILETYDNRIRKEEAYRDKLKLQKQGLMHDLLTAKVRVKDADKFTPASDTV
jgi:type I restriction enzyme S subunit